MDWVAPFDDGDHRRRENPAEMKELTIRLFSLHTAEEISTALEKLVVFQNEREFDSFIVQIGDQQYDAWWVFSTIPPAIEADFPKFVVHDNFSHRNENNVWRYFCYRALPT